MNRAVTMKNPDFRSKCLQRRELSRAQVVFWRAVLTLSFTAVTLGTIAFLFPQQFLTKESGNVKGDVLVVLGGDGGRADRAAELYRQGAAPAVLVTGFGDCAANVQILEKNGVPAPAITSEPKALTTWENANFSMPILRGMNARRVIIVTSWYHSRRALACFKHFAPDLTFYSKPSYFDYEPKHDNREGFNRYVNVEYAKLLVYWLRYGICPL